MNELDVAKAVAVAKMMIGIVVALVIWLTTKEMAATSLLVWALPRYWQGAHRNSRTARWLVTHRVITR